MTNDTERRLAKAAQTLRAASPQGWDEFVDIIKQRAGEITQTLVVSAPDRLQVMQGQAQEAATLYAFLLNAPSLAEKLYEKERQNAHGSQPQTDRPKHHPASR